MKSYRKRISLFALVLVVLLAIGSISAFAAPPQTAAPDVSTPTGAFNAYMTALKKADYKAMQKYSIPSNNTTAPDAESLAYAKTMGQYLTWTVNSVSEGENGTATLEVSITNIKFTNFMRDLLRASILDDASITDDMNACLVDYIKKAEKVITLDVTVSAVKYQDTWHFLPDDAFFNAYLGNMVDGTYAFLEEMSSDNMDYDNSMEWLAYLLAE